MIYRVLTTAGFTGEKPKGTRKRADAAELLAQRIAYDLIAGQGGLDTKWGHAAMDAVKGLDVRRGGTVAIGEYTMFVTCSHA